MNSSIQIHRTHGGLCQHDYRSGGCRCYQLISSLFTSFHCVINPRRLFLPEIQSKVPFVFHYCIICVHCALSQPTVVATATSEPASQQNNRNNQTNRILYVYLYKYYVLISYSLHFPIVECEYSDGVRCLVLGFLVTTTAGNAMIDIIFHRYIYVI